jgi:hypothetical protein
MFLLFKRFSGDLRRMVGVTLTAPVLMMMVVSLVGLAQTQVNLSKQARTADFSLFTATRPWQMVAALPATCKIGEAAFLTTALLGQQLNFCTATNTWNIYSTTSIQTADLLDFLPLKGTADNQLVIGPACAAARPCRARFGEAIVAIVSPAVVTVGGVSSSGTLFVWLDHRGLRVGTSAGSGTVSCNAYCTVVPTTVTTFPASTLPIAAVGYTSNIVIPVTGAMDRRAILSAQRVVAGPSANLMVTSNGFNGSAEVDLSDTIDLAGFNATRVLKRGVATNRPANCQVGDLYHQTNAQANQPAGIYLCKATNQWQGPLVSLDAVAPLEARSRSAAATGNLAPVVLVATGHAAGVYRICGLVVVTTSAAPSTLNLQLSWRSPAAATNQTQTLVATSTAAVGESQACQLVNTTGEAAITVDPSEAGLAVYTLTLTAERLL